MRHTIVHYHTFKNAGSSVDGILKQCFPNGAWQNFDGPVPEFFIPQTEFVIIVKGRPHLKAVSSHQIRLPIPELPALKFLPIVFVRRPELRAASVWRFERAEPEKNPRGDFARKNTFSDWVRRHLDSEMAPVICNLQTLLFSFSYDRRPAGQLVDETTAIRNLKSVPFVGLVEQFEQSIRRYFDLYSPIVPEFRSSAFKARNVTDDRPLTVEQRLEELNRELGSSLFDELVRRNALDIRLYEWVQSTFFGGASAGPDVAATGPPPLEPRAW